MDYRPKFRFQWTWDGYNLIPLNPKAEEVLSRINAWAECSGYVNEDGVHVGYPLSHSWLISTGIFPEVYEQPKQPIIFRTDPASSGPYNYRGAINVRPYPRLGLDTDWGPCVMEMGQGTTSKADWIDYRFGIID